MQSIWWLYALTFIFGYVTCRTFYFVRETRIGLIMLKLSHCIGLYTIVRGLEALEYARNLKIQQMKNSDDSEQNIKAYNIIYDREVTSFKNNAIRDIVSCHPKFYKDFIAFDDWNSAMKFLDDEGYGYIKKFTRGSRHD